MIACELIQAHQGTMAASDDINEGKASVLCSSVLFHLYRATENQKFRTFLRRLILRLEGGPMYSLTIRRIYGRFHGLNVGLYTIGPCEAGPYNFDPGTSIGRYCSIYYTVRTLTRDYPHFTNADHGLFFDSAFGAGGDSSAPSRRLEIGNDVFIGHNAIILPSTEHIGHGAFIGAGAVVSSSVPPYAVVTGNPGRIVRYRFSEKKIKELLDLKWWQKSLKELANEIEDFQKPLEGDAIR